MKRTVRVPSVTDRSHDHVFVFDGIGSHPEPPLDALCACGKDYQGHKDDRRNRGEFVTADS